MSTHSVGPPTGQKSYQTSDRVAGQFLTARGTCLVLDTKEKPGSSAARALLQWSATCDWQHDLGDNKRGEEDHSSRARGERKRLF
jgi:hypothetical protein